MNRALLPRHGGGARVAATAGGRGTQKPISLLTMLMLAAAPALLPVPTGSQDLYLGCYQDIWAPNKPRLFSDFLGDAFTMTPAVCRQLAINRGLAVYGVQFGENADLSVAICIYMYICMYTYMLCVFV